MSERTLTGEASREISVLHLADNPNDTFLLSEELAEEQLASRIERVGDADALRSRLAEQSFDIVVIDLPLPDRVDPVLLDELSAERPELVVVFRWGVAGQWMTEAPAEQLGRAVRAALALRPDRTQGVAERQQVLQQLVRQQQAYLELSKSDLWDFEPAIARITSVLARVLKVARVSVWELSADDQSLRCVDLYDTRTQLHGRAPDLRSFPRYLASLRHSLTLAIHDACQDPRTSEFLEDYLQPLGISAMLDAPIRRAGRVVGVVCHEHVGDELRRWTLLEQCAASSAADLVARAMEVRDRRRFEERAARLERHELVGSLAGGVAHDLNNWLTVLLGNIELASMSGVDPIERRDYLKVAAQAGRAVHDLMHDLLAIGRAEDLARQDLDLGALLLRQEPLLRAAAGNSATLSVTPGSTPIWVHADPSALSRVLLNLVKNAGESLNDPGEVRVSLRTSVNVEGEDELESGACAVLSIQDSGRGMSPETQRRLFEPFFTTKPSRQGHGLGLATSFGLVRQHGGTIRVESALGQGSRFDVYLPLCRGAGETR